MQFQLIAKSKKFRTELSIKLFSPIKISPVNTLMSTSAPSLELKKARTLIELKESFFDDDDIDADPYDRRRKLWIRPQKSHLNSLKPENILFEGLMAKKGKKTKLKKIRYYILTRDFLAYKEVRNKH